MPNPSNARVQQLALKIHSHMLIRMAIIIIFGHAKIKVRGAVFDAKYAFLRKSHYQDSSQI